MIRRPRRNHTPAFKAKVALAFISGEMTLAQLAEHFDVHPNQVTTGKAQLQEGAADVFGRRQQHGEKPAVDVKSLHLTCAPSFIQPARTICLSFGPVRPGVATAWGAKPVVERSAPGCCGTEALRARVGDRRQIAERAVRSFGVVVAAPFLEGSACVSKRGEQRLVQQLVA